MTLCYTIPVESVDRVQLRKDVSVYAKAGSWELARGKLGQLIYFAVQDFIQPEFEISWQTTRCVPRQIRDDIDKVVGIEFIK